MNQRLAWRSTHSSRSPERLEDKKRLYRQVFNKVKSVENVVGRQQQKKMRSADVDDNMAQLMYKARSTNSSAFRPPDSKK
nr:hypothetical protein BaRGS_022785 [Batillaria attramentaria]